MRAAHVAAAFMMLICCRYAVYRLLFYATDARTEDACLADITDDIFVDAAFCCFAAARRLPSC